MVYGGFDNPNTNSPIITLIRQFMFVYSVAAGMGKFFDGFWDDFSKADM